MTTSTVKRCRRSSQTAPASGDAVPGEDADVVMANDSPIHTSGSLSKRDSEEDAWASKGYNYINPFVHRVEIDSHIEVAKVYVLTVLLLPIRVVGCVLSLLSAWMFACIGLYGMTLDDLKARPLTGWRKQMQYMTAKAMRMLYTSGSFHYINMKGTRATPKQAPILVVAPHSSYVDSILVVATGPPSIVAKRETADIPLLGRIINYAQPIYVQREDPNSRQNTIKDIVDRARSTDDWPQVVIFAEGTCTNRTALIKFKPGAFYPGVPVQPVLLKYPNKYDTFTWTWDGPGVLRLLWLTMTQFYNRCEVEYLPVYQPNEAEMADANLYANNVRKVMAKALGVPTSDYSFEDVIIMSRARDMKIPFPGDIVEIERTIEQLGLLESTRDKELCELYLSLSNTDKLDIITFAELLQVDLKNPSLHKLFALLDHRRRGTVSLKSFLLCSLFSKLKNADLATFLRALVNLYSESSEKISRESFVRLMRHAGGKLNEQKAQALYFALDTANIGYVSFDSLLAYTENQSSYKFFYHKSEHIRRSKTTKNAAGSPN
ncbi:lysophosphatidylcholine acyltransferase [Drosophila guanche]|uniref:Blast:1-acylglycerophosphocholine O-acyltransferase 1 n=1 Tax=Drosophila guanche TaxID=7266 RepID=A0A3B0J789_DROGU|nr:lysophosphatidylcholine acyltransferase [Drosophila guanche]SPP77937.1 blast:1-acylglycerophosphocholine O-acyltransferase 1 [Drosophila guanche]